MDTVQIFYWLFAFACEECEDRVAEFRGSLASNSRIDHIFTEAAKGMVFEIGCRCLIF